MSSPQRLRAKLACVVTCLAAFVVLATARHGAEVLRQVIAAPIPIPVALAVLGARGASTVAGLALVRFLVRAAERLSR